MTFNLSTINRNIMKTLPINSAPYTAELYLRKCKERKNSKRINLFEKLYQGACIAVAICAICFIGVSLIHITIILSK